MATVYSLICWGGSAGKSVTASSSTDLITLTNHGLLNATGVCFKSGTLPTVASGAALAVNTTYYAKSISSSTFELYRESSLTTKIDFTSNGSSLVMYSAYYVGLSDKSRWTTDGVERIYDGIAAWNTGRAGASSLDMEICEVGMAYDDIRTSALSINVPSGSAIITSMLNGSRSDAFHNGVHGAGYRVVSNSNAIGSILSLTKLNTTLDGVSVFSGAGYGTHGVNIGLNAGKSSVINCMIIGSVTGTNSGDGISTSAQNSIISKNILCGWQRANAITTYTYGIIVSGNIITKNVYGFGSSNGTYTYGLYYNNISVGNTTNWPTWPNIEDATANAGLSGEALVKGSGYRVTIATSDFANYGGSTISSSDDFSPALVTSPQVETGIEFFGVEYSDIVDGVRPAYPGSNYNTAVTAGSFVAGLSYTIATVGTTDFTAIGASTNTVGVTFKATGAGSGTGTATLNAKIDIGAYEFDLGYGAWPATFTLTIDNVVVGSSIQLEESDGTLIEFRTADSTSEVFAVSASLGVITVKIRKGSSGTKYQPYETQTTAFDGSASIYVSQVADTIAA